MLTANTIEDLLSSSKNLDQFNTKVQALEKTIDSTYDFLSFKQLIIKEGYENVIKKITRLITLINSNDKSTNPKLINNLTILLEKLNYYYQKSIEIYLQNSLILELLFNQSNPKSKQKEPSKVLTNPNHNLHTLTNIKLHNHIFNEEITKYFTNLSYQELEKLSPTNMSNWFENILSKLNPSLNASVASSAKTILILKIITIYNEIKTLKSTNKQNTEKEKTLKSIDQNKILKKTKPKKSKEIIIIK